MKHIQSKIELIFESSIYSKEAVKLAAYIFADKCEVKVSAGKNSTKVFLTGGTDLKILGGEISNEVLNQQCRLDLAKKNSRMAGIILTKALLSACGESRSGEIK